MNDLVLIESHTNVELTFERASLIDEGYKAVSGISLIVLDDGEERLVQIMGKPS